MAASAMPRDLPFQGDLTNYYGWSWFANGQSDCLLVNRFLPDIQGIWICLVCGFFWHVSLNTCSKKCVSTILFSGLCRSRDKLNMWVVSWGFPREVPSRWPWKTDCWSDEYKQIPRKQNKVSDGWVFMTNHIQGCSWIFFASSSVISSFVISVVCCWIVRLSLKISSMPRSWKAILLVALHKDRHYLKINWNKQPLFQIPRKQNEVRVRWSTFVLSLSLA